MIDCSDGFNRHSAVMTGRKHKGDDSVGQGKRVRFNEKVAVQSIPTTQQRPQHDNDDDDEVPIGKAPVDPRVTHTLER